VDNYAELGNPGRVTLKSLLDLTGKSAIVTGGGSGLGLQLADALAEAGANLAICARNLERCESAAKELADKHGVKAIGLECDVRSKENIECVVSRTREELGAIDILVNNAGTSWAAPAEDYPLEGWQKVIDVNLTGMFLLTQTVGRTMIAKGGGKIVNIVSAAALGGAPPELLDAVGYNASKGGAIALTRDLAVKWARHSITINAIAPGWFPTEMSHTLLEGESAKYLSRIPLGRFGGDDDLKGAVVYLASRASDYMTGQILVIDGGLTVS
jgi:NAD(P)-dependent dehydrogenase (short-subunit alcohol dehydrogenase family)